MGASESRPASAPGSDSIAHSGKAEDGSGHAASPDQTRLKGGDYSGFGTVVYEDGHAAAAVQHVQRCTATTRAACRIVLGREVHHGSPPRADHAEQRGKRAARPPHL